MDRYKLIIDCDPGHDDAIAILLAGKSKKIDLIGITCESGNQTIEKTSRNAFNVSCYLGINVPIAIGASSPLIRPQEICDVIHGESGLDGFDFPKYSYKYDTRNATNFLIDTLLTNDDVVIAATGPLTNIALSLKVNPLIKKHIKKIVLMGGSIGNGNVSPAAEFNILCDPEAAFIVFNSGCLIEMIGLDVTRKVLVLPNIIKRFELINNKAADMFIKLMYVFNKNQKKVFGFDGAPLHDPATIVSLIDEKTITFKHCHVEIDISHGPSYGRTNCDVFNYLHKEPNCYVATDIDVDRYWNVIENVMKDYK